MSVFECETISFIDPAGSEYTLSGQFDHDIVEGVAGRGMPPVRVSEITVPLTPGTRLRDIQHGARDVSVPVVFFDDTIAIVRNNLDAIMRTFDPVRGDGTLRVLTPDGRERDLTCRYHGGFEIVESRPERGLSTTQAGQRGMLVFRAFDPYWYDVAPFTATYTVGGAGATFFPIPSPTTGSFISLVGSEVFTTVTIVLDTDVDAQSWPVWTITGPGSSIVLRNLTTGQSLALTANGGLTLGVGEQAILDLRPGVKSLLKNDGTNLYPYLTNSSSLWPLSGTQVVQVEIADADSNTQVELWVRPAHLTV